MKNKILMEIGCKMQRYKVFMYLDTFKDEQGEWVAGDSMCEMKTQLLLPENANDEEIYQILANDGYYVEHLDVKRNQSCIEVTAKKDGQPIVKLQRVVKQ